MPLTDNPFSSPLIVNGGPTVPIPWRQANFTSIYAYSFTGPGGGVTPPTPTDFTIASAGLNFPRNIGNATISTNQYTYWAKRIYVTDDLPSGMFFYTDRQYVGSTQGTAIQKGTTERRLERLELVNVATGAVIPLLHRDNGNPVADGNPLTIPAGGLTFARHGALPKGVYDLDTYEYCPVGGKRQVFQGHEFANMAGDRYKESGTAFHTTAGRPTGLQGVTFSAMTTACMHWASGRRKSVLGLGDSNEDQDNTFNGAFAQGPIRSVLSDPALGNGAVANLGMFRAGSGPSAAFEVSANPAFAQSCLDLIEEAMVLVGMTGKWPFTDIVWQHYRNGATGILASTKQMISRVRAKDAVVRIWPVVPYPYVRGGSASQTVDKTPPADLYASVAAQIPVASDGGSGTTARDEYIAWVRSGGEGTVAGVFDDELDTAPAANPQVYNIGPTQKLKLATVGDASTGPQTVDLDFKPLQADELVIDPGLSTQEVVIIHNTTAPIDMGGGIWRCQIARNTRVQQNHALDAVVQVRLVYDGTHGNPRRQKMRRDSARNLATKNALLAA